MTNRMVTIRTINLKDTNVFLLPCNDGYLLIDTSRPGTYPQFLGAIKDLGIAVGDIRYLFLTHHHWDHVGFINELVNDPKSDVKVVLHEKELPFLSHERMSNLRGRNRGLKLVLWYVHNVMKTCYEPYFPKSDDVIIRTTEYSMNDIGIDGLALHTPGCSEGSISLILETGDSFVGDVAMKRRRLFLSYPAPSYIEDLQQIHDSWRNLIRHGAQVIHPSHGSSFPVDRLHKELEKHEWKGYFSDVILYMYDEI